MTTATRVTEPLRAEHRDLMPHLERLRETAGCVRSWTSETPGRLADAVAFLREHLVPHARAEEAFLYPAVEEAMDSPHATDTMVADHVEIVRRIDTLVSVIESVGAGPADPPQTDELEAQLYGLHAILRLHFAKEEEVLLPELDAHMTQDRADAMFAAMTAVAHPH
jgi:iron-sulfur cluster repair protein YtfE (RIC family)